MTGDLNSDRSTGSGAEQESGTDAWTPSERALLDAALGFYGAAEGVIEFGDGTRPQVRRDAAGFEAIRQAMGLLEERVLDAHAAGVARERIAEVARIEREMVELIIARGSVVAPSPAEG